MGISYAIMPALELPLSKPAGRRRAMQAAACIKGASDEQINTMLDLIYEGPLEARPWQAFVDQLRAVTGATRVSIQLYRPEDAERDIRVTAATHPDAKVDWRSLRDTYRQGYMAADPIRHYKLTPGQIVTLDDCRGSAFRDELLLPLGIDDYVRTSFSEPGGLSGWLQMIGHRPTAPFNRDVAVAWLEILTPHLGRALRLYARILVNQGEKATYQDAISHLSFGSIVLDGRGRILDTNGVAAGLIEKYAEMAVADGKLAVADAAANAELQTAIAAAIAIRKRQSKENYVELVRMRTKCGALLGFLIMPTPLFTLYQGEDTPNVVLYVCDLDQHIVDRSDRQRKAELLVAKLFKLTRSEAKLAVLLADGQTMSEAAMEMGIAEGSARNYSKRIYEKTDIKRQSDLIRLIYKSVALLG